MAFKQRIIEHEIDIDTSKTISTIRVTMGNNKNIQKIAFLDKASTIAECSIYQVDFSNSQTLEAHVPVD